MAIANTTTEEVGAVATAKDGLVLSDYDCIFPKAPTMVFLLYKLPRPQDAKIIAQSLQQGLDNAVEQHPVLAAVIQFDANGKPRKQMVAGSLKLPTRFFETGQHKSYNELSRASFAPRDFDQHRLLPGTAYDHDSAKGVPVTVAQLNFIPGGIIFAVSFNHVPTDMKSIDLSVTLICKCAKACMEGQPIPQYAFDYSREPFDARPELMSLSMKQLEEQLDYYRTINPSATPAAKQNGDSSTDKRPIPTKGVLYRIADPKVQQLKSSCPPPSDVPYISTYDCIVAMLWCSISRVRRAIHPELASSRSRLIHPVDLRDRDQQGLHQNYFGNAVWGASAGPVPVAGLSGSCGLSLAASAVRQSVLSSSLDLVSRVAALSAITAPSMEKIHFEMDGLVDRDFLVTSWFSVETRGWDFGLGPPQAVRTWDLPMSGCALIFPDCCQREGSRMYDVHVMLSEPQQDLLSKDKDFRRWFSIV